MRQNFISEIRSFITNKEEKHNEIDLNTLGYLNIIGFYPSKLIEGKKLYKELMTFINTNHILDKYSPESVDNTIFERLVLYVHMNKWERNKIILADRFEDQLSVTTEPELEPTDHATPYRNNGGVYGAVEYGIIDTKVQKDNFTDTDVKLTKLLSEFNIWIKDYLQYFTKNDNQKYNLFHLVKLIVCR